MTDTQQPERPTCATCPYFALGSSQDLEDVNATGNCRRSRPQIVSALVFAAAKEFRKQDDSITDAYSNEADDAFASRFPATIAYEWCGEHPDFPAWLAATRTKT
jgi:hypothetical protein